MTSCWLYIVSTGWWNTQRACFLFLPLTGAGAGERRINAMNDYTDELDNTIEQTPRFLGTDAVHVHLGRVGQGVLHRGPRDLVERDAEGPLLVEAIGLRGRCHRARR